MYQMSQSYCSSNCGYSRLESIAESYSPGNVYASAVSQEVNDFPSIVSRSIVYDNENKFQVYNKNQDQYLFSAPKPEYNFIPDNFLKPGKEGTFVGKAEEIKEHIEEAFEKMFNCPFPNDIKISVLDEKKFRKLSPGAGTIGLSINRRKHGLLSEIFVKNDYLARVMLTIGHELGHVLTETLTDAHSEEAKAYAFSLMWMQVIKEHNIADLQEAIILESPAENGLHNVAFAYVSKLIARGKKVRDVYLELVRRVCSVNHPS